MMCDCQFDPGKKPHPLLECINNSESDDLSEACGDNCLNRLLMIEW